MSKKIFVTQPSLAPLSEYTKLLEQAWESGILTHNGPLVQKFEKELESKLNIERFISVTNGTIAIQMAIKALELKGEIITTPFTWIATISAIQWEGCTPRFADIDPETLNIDVEKLESYITEDTVAIMPVHVFGNPCDVEAIDKIAKKHNLKVIYDAAHAIGTTLNGKSVLNMGDVSSTSLHATKLLNTGEGGACITSDIELAEKLERIRFFGHDKTKDIVEEGFNGKMTEIHAALGLSNLKYYDEVLEDRKNKFDIYQTELNDKRISFQKLNGDGSNYSYFPIIIESEELLLKIEKALNQQEIYPRRYFYPAVNTYTNVLQYEEMPVAEDISKRILCLPLYWNLKEDVIEKICKIILEVV